MNRSSMFGGGSNLPPGCTVGDIERAFGGDDETCDAHAPYGAFTCNLSPDHEDGHATLLEVVRYSQVPACSNPKCPEPEEASNDTTCYHDFPPSSWIDSRAYGGSDFVAIATWPRRDDDFNEDGEPTVRDLSNGQKSNEN